MSVPFRQEYRAQWRDMDFNQHMANSAFLDYAGNTRMLFLASCGFTAATFAERRIGPVVLEDRVTYARELQLLEPFTVDLRLGAATADARRLKVRNRFLSGSDVVCASIDSVVLWLDLRLRRPTVPPPDLRDAWLSLERAEDFEDWD